MHSSIERELRFRAGLTAKGLALSAEYIRRGDYSFASGYAAAKALLELSEPPTATFASNDNMAAGALKAAVERGEPVPDRLSIIGFDDSDIASTVTPGLTTIHRPFGEMGRNATRQLLKLIDGLKPVPDLAVPLPLVERESTARRGAQPILRPIGAGNNVCTIAGGSLVARDADGRRAVARGACRCPPARWNCSRRTDASPQQSRSVPRVSPPIACA